MLDDAISLTEEAGLGRDDEASTIAYKLYVKGAVPSDNVLLNDLESVRLHMTNTSSIKSVKLQQ